MGARNALELGQQTRQGVAVSGCPRRSSRRRPRRTAQRGGGQYGVERRVEFGVRLARPNADTGSRESGLDVRVGEQLADEGRDMVEARPYPLVRELGAVTQPDHPLGGVVAVVGHLFHALVRDGSEDRVPRYS